ncbi:hypothetical protein [Paludibaculum fermentans]|uniref:hypothetical protein n=1 Tax=Paludibaculum fermentans TaxID=1473598 RepID=UPI00389946FE
MAPDDTSAAAREVYFSRLRELSPSERVRIGVQLWEAGNALQWAAARRKYPGASEEELAFQIACLRFGEKLARAAYRRS